MTRSRHVSCQTVNFLSSLERNFSVARANYVWTCFWVFNYDNLRWRQFTATTDETSSLFIITSRSFRLIFSATHYKFCNLWNLIKDNQTFHQIRISAFLGLCFMSAAFVFCCLLTDEVNSRCSRNKCSKMKLLWCYGAAVHSHFPFPEKNWPWDNETQLEF